VPYYQLAPGSTELPGWTIHDGGIDFIRSDFWVPSEGLRSIDLSAQSAGRITQSLTTTPCSAYRVDFSLSGNPYDGASVKQLRVEAAGQSQDYSFNVSGLYGNSMGWQRYSFTFIANSTTTTLSFRSLINDNGGPALDDISVTRL
jgi:choice-of-anchor C domain-containing protein